jgi:hypothetical protein
MTKFILSFVIGACECEKLNKVVGIYDWDLIFLSSPRAATAAAVSVFLLIVEGKGLVQDCLFGLS